MATVTGLTAARMLEIEAESVVDGDVVNDNLILTTHDGTQINAGNVRGPVGPGVPDGGTTGQVLAKVDSTSQNTRWEKRPTEAENDARYLNVTGDLLERGSTPPAGAATPGTIYQQTASGAGGNILLSDYFSDAGWTDFWKFGSPLVTFPDATSTQVESDQGDGQRLGPEINLTVVPGTVMNWTWTFQVMSGNTEIFAEFLTAPAGGNADYFGSGVTTYNLWPTTKYGPGTYTISGQFTIPANQVLGRTYFTTVNTTAAIGPAVVRYKSAKLYAAGASASDVGTLWVKETGTSTSGWKALSSMSTFDLVAGQDLNSIITPGYYRASTAAIANTLINWPVEAIPRADKADSNNVVAGFRPALLGTLTVEVHGSGNIEQTCSLSYRAGEKNYTMPVGIMTITYNRLRGGDGVTWGPWILKDPTIGVYTDGERNKLSKEVLLGPINARGPAKVSFTYGAIQNPVQGGSWPPVEQVTIDGVQWWREAAQVRQGVGGFVEPPFDAASGFRDYGKPGWSWLRVVRTSAGIIVCNCLLYYDPVPASGKLIFTLPVGMRPADIHIFSAPGFTNKANSIEIGPDGTVRVSGLTYAAPYYMAVSFMFPAADVAPSSAWTPIQLLNGWTTYGAPYPVPASWTDSVGRVWMCGLLKRATAPVAGQTTMARVVGSKFKTSGNIHAVLPSAGAAGSSIFNWSSDATGLIFDYRLPTTTFPSNWGWISLSQAYIHPAEAIPDSAWIDLALQNCSYWGAPFPKPGYWAAPDGIMHFRGLASKGGTGAINVAQLSGNNRYTTNLMNVTANNDVLNRTDMNPAGLVTALDTVSGWYSFDGFFYMMES